MLNPITVAALILGAAGSLPEHGIALIAANKGKANISSQTDKSQQHKKCSGDQYDALAILIISIHKSPDIHKRYSISKSF